MTNAVQAPSESVSVGTRSYRPDIDGLRAVAIIAVVLFHADLFAFRGGFVGVDIFFVISGYLITGHVYRDTVDGRFRLSAFYARRARRILPALLSVLAASLVIGFVLLSANEYSELSKSALSAMLGVSNIYYWYSSNYFSPASSQLPMLMTWSLGVEEQFYLFLPLVIAIVLHFLRKKIIETLAILCVASFLFSVVSLRSQPVFAFYMLPARAWELGLGGVLAVAELRGFVIVGQRALLANMVAGLGIALVAGAIFRLDSSTLFPGAWALLPAVGSMLIIASPGSLVSRLLALRPLVFIGLVSYSWYLWHWPLLSFARIASIWPLDTTMTMTIVAMSFALAVLSYYAIERPFRRGRGTNGATLLRYSGAMAVSAVPFIAALALGGFPQRLPPQVAQVENVATEGEPCLVFGGTSEPNSDEFCLPAVSGDRGIALIGDSHAAALAPGLRALAREQGYQLAVFTKASCPPLADVTRHMPDQPAHAAECASYNAKVMALLKDNPSIRKVVVAGFWSAPMLAAARGERYVSSKSDDDGQPGVDGSVLLESGLSSELRQLRAIGVDVTVMQDVPLFAFDPPRYLLQQAITMRAMLGNFLNGRGDLGETYGSSGDVLNLHDVTRDVVLRAGTNTEGVLVVDPFDILCSSGQCRFADQSGAPFFKDSQHLSVQGSAMIARGILPPESDAERHM